MEMACLAPGGVPRNARIEIVLPKSRQHLSREVALQGLNDFRRAVTLLSKTFHGVCCLFESATDAFVLRSAAVGSSRH